MTDKDLRKIIKALEAAGYTIRISRSGHPIVYSADGERVTTFSGTPGDVRSFRNSLSPLKRRGFQWPPRR